MKTMMASILGILFLGALAVALFVYSGIYNISADEAHWSIVSKTLEVFRDRSIQRRQEDVVVPPKLDDPQLVLKGAGQYVAMCMGCHLAPGMAENDLQQGLYPQPPKLFEKRIDPRRAYVVIKHGIKMTGMPAWGGGDHGDDTIWSLVAFTMQLPKLTPEKFADIVKEAPPDEEMAGMKMDAGSIANDKEGNGTSKK